MIKMDKLNKLIKYTLWSGWIKNEKPVSVLIISNPESGKSSAIEKFKENQGVVYFNDVTPWGLTKEIYKYKDLGKPINHILIPDFLNIMAKNQASAKALIHFFNTAMEEGLTKIQSYGISVDIPTINFGLITAITTPAFMSRRRNWSNIGFLSRMLPFTYKYTLQDAQEILKSIFKQVYHEQDNEIIKFPKEKQEVKLDSKLAEKVYPYSVRLASAEKLYGFRHQKQFQTLLKACALSNNRYEVNADDVKEIIGIAEYCNLEFNFINKEEKN